MTHQPTRTTLIAAVLAGLALLAAACADDGPSTSRTAPETGGGDAETETATVTDEAESPYCRTALAWQVHELTPHDDGDPAAVRSWMDDYVGFTEEAAAAAPQPILADWELNATQIADVLYVTMERFGFDAERAAAEATPEEMAILMEPPPDVAAAQDRIHAYESA